MSKFIVKMLSTGWADDETGPQPTDPLLPSRKKKQQHVPYSPSVNKQAKKRKEKFFFDPQKTSRRPLVLFLKILFPLHKQRPTHNGPSPS